MDRMAALLLLVLSSTDGSTVVGQLQQRVASLEKQLQSTQMALARCEHDSSHQWFLPGLLGIEVSQLPSVASDAAQRLGLSNVPALRQMLEAMPPVRGSASSTEGATLAGSLLQRGFARMLRVMYDDLKLLPRTRWGFDTVDA